MKILLISTYELGHQPFGLASPAAWLRAQGDDVRCLDLSREEFSEAAVRHAELVAFYVPMHTATRLAVGLVERVQRLNPRAHLCFYGLYAPVNEDYLRALGVHSVIGGEFEGALARLAAALQRAPSEDGGHAETRRENTAAMLERLNFLVPDRSGLPPLRKYAHLVLPGGGSRIAGYTEASRGCKHLCRHCPIVPVYNGAFRVVGRDVVLEDIRLQVAAGAEHITFGDPDFFNGPAHARAIVQEFHTLWPQITYDVTIKIEHILKHADVLPALRDTGCLFVTSAVESVDDAMLARLDKGHTRADFLAAIALFREVGLTLQPTFVPFSPWTTLAGYRDLLRVIAENELVEHVAPIQLGIRLLIPRGSRLLELEDTRARVGEFDAASLFYPWKHADARLDALAERVQDIANDGDKLRQTRSEVFARIWQAAAEVDGDFAGAAWTPTGLAGAAIAHFSEPWYCCAEPTRDQFVAIGGLGAAEPPKAAKDFAAQPATQSDFV